MRRLLKRNLRLLQNLARDVIGVADDNSTGVDQFEPAAFVRGVAGDAVARDAGLVADDGSALTGDPIE